MLNTFEGNEKNYDKTTTRKKQSLEDVRKLLLVVTGEPCQTKARITQ